MAYRTACVRSLTIVRATFSQGPNAELRRISALSVRPEFLAPRPAQTLGQTLPCLRTIDVDQADWYNLLRGFSRDCLSRMTIRRKIEALFFSGQVN